MIAVDTSSWIAFFSGDNGVDVEALDRVLEMKQAVLPPVVLTELLSAPAPDRKLVRLIKDLPILGIHPGFWERAGVIRAKVLARKRRARLADTLISQSCIDHRTPLITRDSDFQHFAKYAGLQLV